MHSWEFCVFLSLYLSQFEKSQKSLLWGLFITLPQNGLFGSQMNNQWKGPSPRLPSRSS